MFRLFEKIKNGDVYVIAEMSANHGGSLENALEIVRQVATTGADCLKIQTYTADSLTIDCDNDWFKIKAFMILFTWIIYVSIIQVSPSNTKVYYFFLVHFHTSSFIYSSKAKTFPDMLNNIALVYA